MARRNYTIQSVDNALNVLEAFGEQEGEFNLKGISDKLNMSKTMVFRLMSTFERRGYVQKTEQKGCYRLGFTAYDVGRKFLTGTDLVNSFKPILSRLAARINEAVYLVVRDRESILLLDMVDTTLPVRIMPLVGNSYPAHLTAAGKVIQAFGKRTGPAPRPAGGSSEFAAIRKAGFYADRGAFGEGIASIAVPLIELEDTLPGSLCVVGPEYRLTAVRIQQEILPALFSAGRISGQGASTRAGQGPGGFLRRNQTS